VASKAFPPAFFYGFRPLRSPSIVRFRPIGCKPRVHSAECVRRGLSSVGLLSSFAACSRFGPCGGLNRSHRVGRPELVAGMLSHRQRRRSTTLPLPDPFGATYCPRDFPVGSGIVVHRFTITVHACVHVVYNLTITIVRTVIISVIDAHPPVCRNRCAWVLQRSSIAARPFESS
jgi:hypothetical protein